MAIKALIFGTDDLYPNLKPFYNAEVRKGNMEIVGYGDFTEGDEYELFMLEEFGSATAVGGGGDFRTVVDSVDFEVAILSTTKNFYDRSKFLQRQGIAQENIIDGKVFRVPGLDFPKFMDENVAYGKFDFRSFSTYACTIYPQILSSDRDNIVSLDIKSYLGIAAIEGYSGVIDIGKYSSLAWKITFEMGLNCDHNHKNVSNYGQDHLNWNVPENFYHNNHYCKMIIGNDVWVGRGCCLKSTKPDKPLTIGDGAIVAADSVVVKDVPPYAIVGGNPAKFIKWRFPEKTIEALLRIKWWDWSLDKIHDNFQYFNDIEKFIELHDKGD